MATYLSRTPSSTGNRQKYTWSGWVKRCAIDGTQQNLMAASSANNDFNLLYFSSGGGDELVMYFADNGATGAYLQSTRKFRDPNAWYHIVARVDTTHGTADNRIRLYVNGEQLTTFVSRTNPSQNYEGLINSSGNRMDISGSGSGISAGTNCFKGLMSHVHFLDGEDRDASYFGETDSTTGEWKIKTNVTGVNYGTNGFFILKDGNSVTDQSGNGNNFTVGGGTLTKTEDCPSNVFCTLNVLNGARPTGGIAGVIKYGNTEFRDGENGSNYAYIAGTMGANSGKFYWETKVTDLAEIDQIGVALASSSFVGAANSNGLQATTYGGKGCQFSNGYKVGDGSGSAYMGGFSVNDIMMVALDLDNNKITFGRNGQWADGSGNANQTYANSTAAYTNLTAGEYYVPAQAKRASGANYGTNNYNFGNGYFGTTAVSSAGTNASGNGILNE
jgi:hypothetical protein